MRLSTWWWADEDGSKDYNNNNYNRNNNNNNNNNNNKNKEKTWQEETKSDIGHVFVHVVVGRGGRGRKDPVQHNARNFVLQMSWGGGDGQNGNYNLHWNG